MAKAHTSPRWVLAAVIILTVCVRFAAQHFMPSPVESDSKIYFAMAQGLASGDVMRDIFGQIAFYSPGYPLLLAPLFIVFGSNAGVALAFNLLLSAFTVGLLCRVTMRLSGSWRAAMLAGIGYAIWIPAILHATLLSKENVSLPLMLGFVMALLNLLKGDRPLFWAASAGLIYGASILTGASALLIILGFGIVLYERHGRTNYSFWGKQVLAFVAGVLLLIAPWMLHTNAYLGKAVLTTNSGFNLYLGNNPAATGSFVGIENTPAGPDWNRLRAREGEWAASAKLGNEAKAYMLAHPERTILLAFKKLCLFWTPNIPDAADYAANPKIVAIRWIDVAQHILILLFGLWAMFAFTRNSPKIRIVVCVVVSFWALHAATYNIVRYREPVMPLMLALASVSVARIIERRTLPFGIPNVEA